MNHRLIRTATLAVAGTLLVPVAASADPTVLFTQYDTPVDSAEAGTVLHIEASGCIDPGSEDTPILGMFVSFAGDPLDNPDQAMNKGHPVDALGGASVDHLINADTPAGTWYMRWYCSRGPVTALGSPNILWAGPLTTMDIGTPAARPAAAKSRVASRSVAFASAKVTTSDATVPAPSVTISSDPDALPTTDRLGINGAPAARLKARVDRTDDGTARFDQFVSRLRGRPVTRASLETNARYVAAIHMTLGLKQPSAAKAKALTARLDAGELKVTVVEDIALTQRNAAWWNKR